jgi:hypothetical protein
MAITELPSDFGQRAVVKKDGSKRLVTPMHGWIGMNEEVVAAGVVHGATSANVMGFFGKSFCQGNPIARRVGKPRPGQGARKHGNSRGKRPNLRGDGSVGPVF